MAVKPFYIKTKGMNEAQLEYIFDKCKAAGLEFYDRPTSVDRRAYYGVCRLGNDLTYYHKIGQFHVDAQEVTLGQLDEWLGISQTETPEEKEAFDCVNEQCEMPDSDDCIYTELRHIGDRIHNIACGVDDDLQNFLCDISSKLWSIETPQQREERERLEAAYDLYCNAQHAVDVIGYDSFGVFKSDKVQVKFWLSIVDKTDYRKAK